MAKKVERRHYCPDISSEGKFPTHSCESQFHHRFSLTVAIVGHQNYFHNSVQN